MSIFVLNWKMQKRYKDSILWIKEHNADLIELLNYLEKIIICPSFDSLASIKELVDLKIDIGAQDCSEFEFGAYTGQVSVLSLKDIGCKYCIVGHSESINSNNNIKDKILVLLKNSIIPIICISENRSDLLNSIINLLINYNLKSEIYIAYEPLYAIGSGLIPVISELSTIINDIKNNILKALPNLDLRILYGGSVHYKNIELFKDIKNLDGFLLGNSSLDFQLLKKTVLLFSR